MIEIEFDYQQIKTIMPAKIEDNFETIAEEYANKTNGRIIKMDDIINNIMNKLDV